MRVFKKIIFFIMLLHFVGCDEAVDLIDGGINHVTVGQDGKTSFNPPVAPVSPSQPAATTPPSQSQTPVSVSVPAPAIVKGTDTAQTPSSPPSIPSSQPPSIPSSQPPSSLGSESSGSILDGLPPLSKKVFFTERESAGMPRVNGERIEADVYGSNILIIRYSKKLNKIRYSNNIKNIDKLGQIEDQNAQVEYPSSFVKIFYEADNGDVETKIFGIIENK